MKAKIWMKRARYKSILSILCMVALLSLPSVGLVGAASATITVFERENSNWNHPAVTTITIPCAQSIDSIQMNITGYCDPDDPYGRALNFNFDGKGGWIGTEIVAQYQYRGYGTISPGQTKTWLFDLSSCQFANDLANGLGSHYLNLIPYFTQGTHTVTAFISTQDGLYGATQDTWISITLYIEYTPCVAGSLFSDALGILPLAAFAGALVVLHRRRHPPAN